MAEKDLIPMNMRTKEEQKEITTRAGIASGKARKQKKNMAQLTAAIMSKNINNLDDLKKDTDIKPLLEMIDEDKTMASLMVAGQIRSAMKGNSRAFELITDLNEKSQKQDESNKKYTIPITDITIDFVELYRVVHEAFETGKYREIISKGGRGSIKSNFWAAIAEETIYNDNQAHVVYTRRYKTDLRGSVYNQFMKTIIRHNMLDEWDFTTSPMMAKYKKTGQCVIFVGADKPISLKSYNLSFGYVKLLIHEECDEMAGLEQMDNIEDTFLRSDTFALDIKVFNPPKSANNFMNEYVNECRNKDTTYISHSYYYNVPVKWLGQRFFERAEWFKQHKPRYYANNYMGEVVGTGGTIFENLETRTITDSEIDSFDSISNGLDFGFEHPQTFIRSYYDHEKDILYPFYEVWARKCKNSTFARKIKEFKNVEIIADSARPDSIAEMQDWGFDIIGAKKRWGSNKGREYCWEWLQQTTKIIIDPERTPKLYEEMSKLEFEQLKDGSFSSQYPTLGEDSIMALIYGLNKTIMESRRENCYDDLEEDDEEYAN
ncbi:MAG: hypothetical protein BV456_06110 [Thermoplasmata archaeon M8B2D]|nr:MAG: hypothetical protein BV456_06110 [Thermoplasmata archaeon M8B2D]